MTDLLRLPDWRARFEIMIDDLRRKPFDWATQHDCGPGLAGNAVLAITGVDVAAAYRGRYTTKSGALRVMKSAGFENLADFVASILPEIPEGPCMAKIGDILAIPAESVFGFALGVCNGERVFVLRPEGIGHVNLLMAKRAFKVG